MQLKWGTSTLCRSPPSHIVAGSCMRLRFSHTFTVSGAPVAFAFTFPYSYQQLQSDLDAISKQHGAGRPEERLFGCSMRSTAQGQGRWSARCSPSADGALDCGEAEQLEAASDVGQGGPGEGASHGTSACTGRLPAGLTAAARSSCSCHGSLPDCSCVACQWQSSWQRAEGVARPPCRHFKSCHQPAPSCIAATSTLSAVPVPSVHQ